MESCATDIRNKIRYKTVNHHMEIHSTTPCNNLNNTDNTQPGKQKGRNIPHKLFVYQILGMGNQTRMIESTSFEEPGLLIPG